MLQALFFDFDGLILDTETPEVEAWQEIFREHGVEFPDENWIYSIGRGADQIQETPPQLLGRLLGRPVDEPEVEEEYHRRRIARIARQPVLPGVESLAAAALADGVTVYVVSSSHHWWVDGHLDRLGIAPLFEQTVCREDAARAKPFPDLYLKALELAGVPPSDAVALEDSPNGLAAAHAAKLFAVTAPNPLTRRLDLSLANHRVDSLADVSLDGLRHWLGGRT